MRDLLLKGLRNAQSHGATYADIRWVSRQTQTISVKNAQPEAIRDNMDTGIGIRVLANGAWGFAAISQISDENVQKIAARAVKLARAAALPNQSPVTLPPNATTEGSYRTEVKQDPFEISLTEKLELLKKATSEKIDQNINHTRAQLHFFKEKSQFANTDGSYFNQEIVHSGAELSTQALKSGQTGLRSYPAGLGGSQRAAGYEFIESLDLPGQRATIQQEALQLLDAPACSNALADIIVDSSQMALQVHESCGHPLELDRIFGSEISLAGGSFVNVADRDHLSYTSPKVTITADATLKGGLGSFGIDDEGVLAQRTVLIEKGVLRNFLTSRETAMALQQRSNGTMRADGWRNTPLIRMTNINLEPGDWTLKEMIRELKKGILFQTNTSWSIDDLRLNFQFATEIGYVIDNGSVVGIVRNPVYSGRTPDFWQSCDAVGNNDEWQLWGINNCGKGDPIQIMRVGHGAPPARFRQVRVGM